jgi:predicted HTH transcriptional regulator
MEWKEKAIKILKDSLYPVPAELNELDWKSGISPKTERIAHHISAFSNLQGGGMLVFGVNDNGSHFSLKKEEADNILKLIGNIALNNLSQAIKVEHAILEFEGDALLFIYIPEQVEKPVYLRGKDFLNCYCRSAGQTVKMSQSQVKSLIARTQGITFEQQLAIEGLKTQQVLTLLNYKKLYDLLDKTIPKSPDIIMRLLNEYKLCIYSSNSWSITNLGAILFANDIEKFPGLKERSVIVRKYIGSNNLNLEFEQIGKYGYAVGFEGLVDFISLHTLSPEDIGVIRKSESIYPKVAIREFVANALVHQDFAITGMPITIEIFSNRLSITNPGAPLNDVNRLIDLPPHSRNEQLAQSLLLFGICERRGSGIDRAIAAIEEKHLPPIKITKSEQHTRVYLYPPKKLTDMTKEEKIRACYQHACLLHESNMTVNNQTVRERFEINKNNSSVASRIIADTLEAGFIKLSDSDIVSRKFATYVPYYA